VQFFKRQKKNLQHTCLLGQFNIFPPNKKPAVMFPGAVPVLRLSRSRSSITPNPKTAHEELSAVHRSERLVIRILQAVDVPDANLFADCVRIFVMCDFTFVLARANPGAQSCM
jgi:hypothetical protein